MSCPAAETSHGFRCAKGVENRLLGGICRGPHQRGHLVMMQSSDRMDLLDDDNDRPVTFALIFAFPRRRNDIEAQVAPDREAIDPQIFPDPIVRLDKDSDGKGLTGNLDHARRRPDPAFELPPPTLPSATGPGPALASAVAA